MYDVGKFLQLRCCSDNEENNKLDEELGELKHYAIDERSHYSEKTFENYNREE